jgi:hypothetical protein
MKLSHSSLCYVPGDFAGYFLGAAEFSGRPMCRGPPPLAELFGLFAPKRPVVPPQRGARDGQRQQPYK